MADAEKEKQERLAAARKRVEALKKQKSKKAGATAEKKKDDSKTPNKDTKAEDKVDPGSSKDEEATATNESEAKETAVEEFVPDAGTEAKPETQVEETAVEKPASSEPLTPRTIHGRQPSLSIQSKMRSTSFRRSSNAGVPLSPTGGMGLAPLSPESNSMGEIYRKQAVRLEELERENKRLTKDLDASENRWRKAEEELEELRSTNAQIAELKSRAEKADAKAEELEKLNLEIQSLKRQNSHLQSISSKTRHSPASPSISSASISDPSDLSGQLASKTAAIESMEMEISNLRARLARTDTSSASHSEQVTALEEKVDRAERAAGAAQRELLDLRKNLERASEKALKAGTENTSSQARIAELEREFAATTAQASESTKRAETLEKKLTALTNLHKEADTRRRDGEREIGEMKKRIVSLENESNRYKAEAEKARKKIASSSGGEVDEGLDELEDEQRLKLESRVRELESELFEARRGVWRDKRRELQGDMPVDGEASALSPGGGFDEVDLSGGFGGGAARRGSVKPNTNATGGRGLADVLSSGLQAFTGGATNNASSSGSAAKGHARNESLALLDDEDDFDENAFRAAQEEEALKRVERVKEVKRGLNDWKGYRIDIVDLRMGGGGGIGEIFDV